MLGVANLGNARDLDGAPRWIALAPRAGAPPDPNLGAVRLACRWRHNASTRPTWAARQAAAAPSEGPPNELAILVRTCRGPSIGDDARKNKGVFAVARCDGSSRRTAGKTWDASGFWNEELALHVESATSSLDIEVRDRRLTGSIRLGEASAGALRAGDHWVEANGLAVRLSLAWRHNPAFVRRIDEDEDVRSFDASRANARQTN